MRQIDLYQEKLFSFATSRHVSHLVNYLSKREPLNIRLTDTSNIQRGMLRISAIQKSTTSIKTHKRSQIPS